MSVLVAVTDHAEERYRQRVGGALDAKPEIVRRVAAAWDADRVSEERGTVHVRDLKDRSLVYVCRRDGAELVVITLWEQPGGVAAPKVDREWTDALRDRRR